MKKSRGFTNPTKGFLNRRKGVMKKANILFKLTRAHMAVMCEYEGDIYIYQSDDHFSPLLNGVRTRQRFGPDHFDTVADRATGVSYYREVVPDDDKELAPTLPSSSSSFNHSDEDMPVVTLGSPLSPAVTPSSDLAATVKHAAPGRYRQPYPLAVDFFGEPT